MKDDNEVPLVLEYQGEIQSCWAEAAKGEGLRFKNGNVRDAA